MEHEIFEKYGLKPHEVLADTGQIAMWKMTQPAINRTVLVHVLSPSLAANPAAVKHIFGVARTISNCSGPAFGQIYTIFNEFDLKAVVTEYVDGMSLEKTINALGPLSLKQVARTGVAIAESLSELWDSCRYIHGGVLPEYAMLDPATTAKLLSPCFAKRASADAIVPASDMSDLSALLYFLATGVKPGEKFDGQLPASLLSVMERLDAEDAARRYAGWDEAIADLKAIVNESERPSEKDPPLKSPGVAAKGSSAKNTQGIAVKKRTAPIRTFKAPSGSVPKAVKSDAPKAKVVVSERNSFENIRKNTAARRAREEANRIGGSIAFFALVVLLLALGVLFVLRVGFLELDATHQVAPQPRVNAFRAEPAAAAAGGESEEEAAELNRYLAAHVGEEIPFISAGTQHQVTLVSYDELTVTVRTTKPITIRRADLTPEQRALWK